MTRELTDDEIIDLVYMDGVDYKCHIPSIDFVRMQIANTPEIVRRYYRKQGQIEVLTNQKNGKCKR